VEERYTGMKLKKPGEHTFRLVFAYQNNPVSITTADTYAEAIARVRDLGAEAGVHLVSVGGRLAGELRSVLTGEVLGAWVLWDTAYDTFGCGTQIAERQPEGYDYA
jgi:hypothetical protein